jgi:hypothetical protein
VSRSTASTAAVIWLVSVAVIAIVGGLTIVSGSAGTIRDALAFSFPPRDRLLDFGVVLMRNGLLAATALALARSGARVAVATLFVGWIMNVGTAGAALGAYGDRIVRHSALYGVLELVAFSFVLAICIRLIRNGSRVRGGELLLLGALFVVAALTETVWSASL